MTFKKIFAFTSALLLIAGSVFCVSAETPPYSANFESEEDMLTALSDYAEEYPYYDGFEFNNKFSEYYHMEYRQVRTIGIGVTAIIPEYYSIGESRYGQGVDYTFNSFAYENGASGLLRAFVYYGYNSDEIKTRLENAKKEAATFDEGIVDGKNYVVCEWYPDWDLTQIDYYIVADDCLVHVISHEPYALDGVNNIFVMNTDVYIPVRVKDNADWFDKTIEKGYVIGDANADGELNIKDATTLQKYCAKLSKVDKLVADFNGDLEINVKDATDIQKKLAGLKYTSRRELYPVTFSHRNNTEEKFVESVSYSSGPLSGRELDLILNYDTPEVSNYTTVFNSAEEFEAFFGRTLDKFDEEFFKTKSLVYLYRFYHSSSQSIEPASLQYLDGVLHIFCGYDEPDAGEGWQEALANYNLFFEVNKEDIKDLKGIKVSEVMAVED